MARRLAVVALALTVGWPAVAAAQAEFAELLAPMRGGFEPRLELRGTWLAESGDGGAEVREDEEMLSLRVPIAHDERSAWAGTARVMRLGFASDARLAESGRPIPSDLWDISAGAVYRRSLGERRGWGGNVAVGSASDEPFDSARELEVRANAYYMVPSGASNAWLFLATYSNTREFLRNVPLPSVAYLYRPSQKLTALFGVPLWVDWRPNDRFGLQASFFPVRTVNLKGTLRVAKGTRVFAGLESRYHGFLLAGREEREDRLFAFDRRLLAGLAYGSPRAFLVELAGGWAFDRQVFLGRKWDDDADRVELDSTPFVSLRLTARL